jgi:hypothetical protein
MPAKSVGQRRLFAIAEHNPSALFPQDRQIANLPTSVLQEFDKTNEATLPFRVRKNFITRKSKKLKI